MIFLFKVGQESVGGGKGLEDRFKS